MTTKVNRKHSQWFQSKAALKMRLGAPKTKTSHRTRTSLMVKSSQMKHRIVRNLSSAFEMINGTRGMTRPHRCRRMPPKHNEIVKKELDLMLEVRIVTPAFSAWSFPVVIATKEDGKPRFRVDYRALNQLMKPDRFTLPKIHKIFDELAGGVYYKTLDFFSGYWLVSLNEQCKKKTTFVCRFCTYQFEVMPFAFMNAPSTFQRMMNSIFGNFSSVKVYLDDLVVFSKHLHEHTEHIRQFVLRVSEHRLKLKIQK